MPSWCMTALTAVGVLLWLGGIAYALATTPKRPRR